MSETAHDPETSSRKSLLTKAESLSVVLLGIGGVLFALSLFLMPLFLLLFSNVLGVVLTTTCALIAIGCFLGIAAIKKHAPIGRGLRTAFIVDGIGLLICATVIGFTVYESSLTIPESSFVLERADYLPFSNSPNIARLDQEASLRFSESDDLPILDGATALVPIYAAVIEATYPASTPLSDTDEAYSSQMRTNEDGTKTKVFSKNVFKYGNTSGAYLGLTAGTCDVAFCAYPSEEQIEYAESLGIEFKYTPIGREGFVFFVNQGNPVDSLTADEIRDIYQGRITSWSEVGGTNTTIDAYQRNEGSGSQSEFERFMGTTSHLKEPVKAETSGSMGGIVERVADYKNDNHALGFSFRYFTQEMMANYPVKLLAIDGVEPTPDNISSGDYPLTGDFYAVTRTDTTDPNVDRLLEWLQSDEGQELVEKTGYARIGS